MGSIEENAIIVRHNTLIESRHKLTLQENRLLLWLISQISVKDTEFTRYTISAKELAEFIGIESHNIYAEMKKTTNLLLSRVVEIENKKKTGYKQFQILSEAEYEDGVVEIEIHKQMQPLLLQIKENFTKVELKYAIRFSGIYAARIYDFLMLNKFKKQSYHFSITLENLRNILGLSAKQYSAFPNFRRRILEPAREEINTRTNIRVEYDYKRTGRKITAINFIVTPQGEDIPYLPASSDDKILKKLQRMGFNARDGADFIEKYRHDPERITFHIDYVEHEVREGNKVENPAGLFSYVIKQDKRRQTSFKEQLKDDDRKKAQRQKEVLQKVRKVEQDIKLLETSQEVNRGKYEQYREQQVILALESIGEQEQAKITDEFQRSFGSKVEKDMFIKYGWTSRLHRKDVLSFLADKKLILPVLKQNEWFRKNGLKTDDEIQKAINDLRAMLKV